ncbi:MAG: nitroreductase [Cyanobium sp. CACIAM 14]|nr:MAG: nitroreductase [Cyanobium sp. CACIAM 14]
MACTPADLAGALRWRYATKRFDAGRRIPAPIWAALEDALVQSPSSYGLQPWKFLLIEDPKLRAALRPHSWDQPQITDCSHLVVFLARTAIGPEDLDRLIQATAEARGLTAEQLEPYRSLMQKDLIDGPRSGAIDRWASNQVYIALGTFLTAAALMAVDACPIEGFSPADYDRILHLEGGPYRSCVVCAAGYRHHEDRYASLAKVRYAPESLIEIR